MATGGSSWERYPPEIVRQPPCRVVTLPAARSGFSGSPSQPERFLFRYNLPTRNNTVATSLSFVINASPQTITFGTLASVSYGSAPFVVSATSNSGLPVSFLLDYPFCLHATFNGYRNDSRGWSVLDHS